MARKTRTRGSMVVGMIAIGCVAAPAAALAHLPHPKTTAIVPGISIAGVKIDMNKAEVFDQWGHTGCMAGFCTWQGPGDPSHAERATVSFGTAGTVIQVAINAGTASGTNVKFKPGTLSKWKTGKNIGLGSTKESVKKAYPAAKANNSTGVNGFDLASHGHFTRFSSFGIGATPDRLRYIELFCNAAGQC